MRLQQGLAALAAAALVVVLGSGLSGCATGYGPKTATGGYSDEKLNDTHYRVKFDGNGNSSKDRVWGFWMHRCAELTLEKGYTHFMLKKPGDPLSTAPLPEHLAAQLADELGLPPAGPRPATYHPNDAGSPHRVLTAGGVTYIPIYIPATRITTFHTDAVVAMFREPLPENVLVLQAKAVLDALGPYVKSNGTSTLVAREDLFRRAAVMNRARSNYLFGGPL